MKFRSLRIFCLESASVPSVSSVVNILLRQKFPGIVQRRLIVLSAKDDHVT